MDLKIIKQDLIQGIRACSERGLYQSVKWLAELNFSIKDVKIEENYTNLMKYEDCEDENEAYLLAKSYFDTKEYDRCAYFIKDSTHPKSRFLYYYTKYMSIEKKKLDNMTDTTCPPDPTKNQALKDLCSYLKSDYNDKKLDGYGLYLYAVVMKKLDLIESAIDVFVESVHKTPMLWAAWQELSLLISNKSKLQSLTLPDHWIKQFFLAHAYLEQLNNDEALHLCSYLQNMGFKDSSYLLSQTAIIYHNRRDLEMAIETFQRLLEQDPYRLDNLDTYSNLLYVKELKSELADLAQNAVSIDKYRLETCCVIGNYYSLRSDHQKAVLYFQRALKLNPYYLSAWTLMGHEYMEMKNTNAAIQSYRQAIDINKRDYRAWYGLGQTYEILKMYSYSLYYYKQSQQLRPNDSRMIIALGETYERLDKIENAIKCYHKASRVGDIERLALLKLAKLYDKVGMYTDAANVYSEYIYKETAAPESMTYEEQSDYYNALEYLASTHLEFGRLDEAYNCAYKCLDYEETKDQAKALLKSIAAKRGEMETVGMTMEEATTCNITETSSMSMDETGDVGEIYSPAENTENE